MNTLRFRSATWFATGVVLTLVAALMITRAWSVDAAATQDEATVVAVNPQVRILDTRDGVDLGLPGPFASPTSQQLQVTGSIPTSDGTAVVVPDGATGVLLNVTAVRPTAAGFISVRPGDATGTPTTSSLNFEAGSNTPNAVTVALPTDGANEGAIDITYSAGDATGPTTEVLVDVVGYLTDSSLKEIETRLATLEAGGTPPTILEPGFATATSDADEDDARDAAPEVPLYSNGTIELYGKCFASTDDDTVSGEIFARTAESGAVLNGDDKLPDDDGADFLDTTTSEKQRQVAKTTARINEMGEDDEFFDYEDLTGHIIEPDGDVLTFVVNITVKRADSPGADGPLPAGNSCAFGGDVSS